MPHGFGRARWSARPVRSGDTVTTCGAGLAACKPRRAARKVAQNGSIWGVFRASVHQCTGAAFGNCGHRGSIVELSLVVASVRSTEYGHPAAGALRSPMLHV